MMRARRMTCEFVIFWRCGSSLQRSTGQRGIEELREAKPPFIKLQCPLPVPTQLCAYTCSQSRGRTQPLPRRSRSRPSPTRDGDVGPRPHGHSTQPRARLTGLRALASTRVHTITRAPSNRCTVQRSTPPDGARWTGATASRRSQCTPQCLTRRLLAAVPCSRLGLTRLGYLDGGRRRLAGDAASRGCALELLATLVFASSVDAVAEGAGAPNCPPCILSDSMSAPSPVPRA
jgi:hypothetical protein